jgi:hypothetical protein
MVHRQVNLRPLPEDASLTPGRYLLELRVESSARGDALRQAAEGGIYRALQEIREDPELWLRFRPQKVEILESVSPDNPDHHLIRLWFEILDLQVQMAPAGALLIAGWLIGLAIAGLTAYGFFRILQATVYAVSSALEGAIQWVVPLFIGGVAVLGLARLARRWGIWAHGGDEQQSAAAA